MNQNLREEEPLKEVFLELFGSRELLSELQLEKLDKLVNLPTSGIGSGVITSSKLKVVKTFNPACSTNVWNFMKLEMVCEKLGQNGL